MKIEKSILGVAGEFAVAAELCRRNIYAQLTLGHQKRIDLLVVSPTGRMIRIEVKAKQGPVWPNCKGVFGEDVFLALVDFKRKAQTERPDFYVLTVDDWIAHVERSIREYKAKYPDRRAIMDEMNCPVFSDEVNKYGKAYRGCGVHPDDVKAHQEAWRKIADSVGVELSEINGS